MEQIKKALTEFIKKGKLNLVIVAAIFVLIATVFISICIAFKQYISILLVIGIFLWCRSPIKKPHFMSPKERERILRICKNLGDILCYEFDKYADKLHITTDFPFLSDEPIIQPDQTVLRFWAKAKIGKADIFIAKLKEKRELINLFLSKKVISCVSRRMMNIDIQNFVKVNIDYKQNAECGNYCEIIVIISNQIFPYYLSS